MAGTLVDREAMDRKNERERKRYRRSADLSSEELAIRRAKQAAYQRAYYARRGGGYTAKRSAYVVERARKIRAEVIAALGGQCRCCGHKDQRVLQVDHVNGGGRAHRKRSGNGYHYWTTILKRIEEFQVLCANCHMIKTYREGPCEHPAAPLALGVAGDLPSGS